jgi:hypothetical protein
LEYLGHDALAAALERWPASLANPKSPGDCRSRRTVGALSEDPGFSIPQHERERESDPPAPRRLPARIGLFAAVALAAAFGIQGRHRRDESPGDRLRVHAFLTRLRGEPPRAAAIAALIAATRAPSRRDVMLFAGLIGLSLDVFW